MRNNTTQEDYGSNYQQNTRVSMSTRRWNRMLQLEEAYKLGRIIKRSMKQVETEPSLSGKEAIEQLRAL